MAAGVVNVTSNYTGDNADFKSFCPSVPECGPVTVSLPLTSTYNTSKTLLCVRLNPADNTARSLNATTTNVTFQNVSGLVATCQSTVQGAFLVVQYEAKRTSAEPAVASPSPSPSDTTPATAPSDSSAASVSFSEQTVDGTLTQTYIYTFAIDFNTLNSDPAAMAAFKENIRKAFLIGVSKVWIVPVTNADGSLQLSRVTVTNVRPGSVVADIMFKAPAGTSQDQLNNLTAIVSQQPEKLFAGSSYSSLVLGAKTDSPGGASGPGGLSAGGIAGVVVGCIVGVIVAAAVMFLVLRHRRPAAVEAGYLHA